MCLSVLLVSFVYYIYVFGRCRRVLFTVVMCLAGVVVSFVHYSYVFVRSRGEFCLLYLCVWPVS